MAIQASLEISIRLFTESDEDFKILCSLWGETFPKWTVDGDLLRNILHHPFLSPQGRHFIAFHPAPSDSDSDSTKAIGFILTYLGDEGKKGYISTLGVLPEYRGKGLGSLLLERGMAGLRVAAGEKTGGGKLEKIVIGSETPRFWPGLPVTFGEDVKTWWGRRGFKKSNGPIIKDLFKDIRTEVVPPDVKDKVERVVKEKGLRFSPWDERGYEKCMEKQGANFSWAKAYAVLAASNQYHEVMVAFDTETNEQLGWTLMCGPEAIVKDMFAFMPISGDVAFGSDGQVHGEGTGREERKIGLIAAVGVDKKARGRGVGLAMVVRAMENLKERGVEGVFIDSVAIRDFYEKLGFEMRWEYESWELVGGGEGKGV
ncbi:hypothetical protein DL98DRAFT_658472 [Cadophora sp. DSE1049]|nr:hypothetical protein DL98DRAFT_658472 [Cadophora sp. DSE1049]